MKRPFKTLEELKASIANRPPLSREELETRQKRRERDEELAAMFLLPEQWDDKGINGIPHYNFLPPDAEKEAYAALSRVLDRIASKLFWSGEKGWPEVIMIALAQSFDPNQTCPMRAFLRRRSTNTGNPIDRDYEIARWVDKLRRVDGLSYNDAAEKVASILQLTPPHIKKIYGKNLEYFEPLRRKRKSGK
jgi:hypothetical protein